MVDSVGMPPKEKELRGLIPVGVFVSFDHDHDEDLKTVTDRSGEERGFGPFTVSGWSLEKASDDGEGESRALIMRADQVIVLCGKHTDAAHRLPAITHSDLPWRPPTQPATDRAEEGHHAVYASVLLHQ